MVIRPALPADAQELACLGERLWRETYTGLIPQSNLDLHLAETFGPAIQAAELADPTCTTLVMSEGGVLLGYALLRDRGPEVAAATICFARALEVARFYLDASCHGTGAAQSLMQAVLDHAASTGHDGLWLQVWEQNPRAIRFYAKAGFVDVGEASFRIGEQVDRDRVLVQTLMAKPLRPRIRP
jgi:ribosomal protein S18 acetylase RimI-like enzyme